MEDTKNRLLKDINKFVETANGISAYKCEINYKVIDELEKIFKKNLNHFKDFYTNFLRDFIILNEDTDNILADGKKFTPLRLDNLSNDEIEKILSVGVLCRYAQNSGKKKDKKDSNMNNKNIRCIYIKRNEDNINEILHFFEENNDNRVNSSLYTKGIIKSISRIGGN